MLFIQTNIRNANSNTPVVELHTSLLRLLAIDQNITTLIIDNNIELTLEWLVLASTERDLDNNSDTESDNDDETTLNNFYRTINNTTEEGLLWGADEDIIYPKISGRIAICPHIQHLIINGAGNWLDNQDFIHFFEELHPNTTTTLTLKNITFNTDNADNLIAILALPKISTLIIDNCNFPQFGVEIFLENEGQLQNYKRINMRHCTFQQGHATIAQDGEVITHDGEDVDFANYLSGIKGLQELIFIQCGLSPKAIKILRRIIIDGNRITEIEN